MSDVDEKIEAGLALLVSVSSERKDKKWLTRYERRLLEATIDALLDALNADLGVSR